MDRFIVSLIENNKRKLTGLKSNMDRFIGFYRLLLLVICLCLKSNMDRFIDIALSALEAYLSRLKSNMDRFIDIISIYLNRPCIV